MLSFNFKFLFGGMADIGYRQNDVLHFSRVMQHPAARLVCGPNRFSNNLTSQNVFLLQAKKFTGQ